MSGESLRELIAAVRGGDHDAFRKIVERYGDALRIVIRRRLHRIVRTRLDSEDVVQEAWRSFWEARHRLGDIRTDEALMKYLQRFVRNRVLQTNRDQRREQRTPLMEEPLAGAQPSTLEKDVRRPSGRARTASEFFLARERLERLRDSLAPGHWQVVDLRLQGYTQLEIAEQLRISERTIRRILKSVEEQVK
jgi:RNA polymerase sigma factor (sigma-70 family)